MTSLDDLLYMFKNAEEASLAAGLSPKAAYHWFASGSRRRIPTNDTLVKLVDHFGLGDQVLGEVVRDSERVRQRQRGAPKRYNRQRRKRKPGRIDWKAKEKFLEKQENFTGREGDSSDVLDRLTKIIGDHIK